MTTPTRLTETTIQEACNADNHLLGYPLLRDRLIIRDGQVWLT